MTVFLRRTLLSGCVLAGALWLSAAKAASTLDIVRARDTLRCGVIGGLPGLSNPDSSGNWAGFHADLCRAIASVALGDPAKVTFISVTGQTRFTAVQSGEIDVLESVTALSIRRDMDLGMTLPVVAMYTGQGVLVSNRTGAKIAKQLDSATICAVSGGEIEHNLADFAARNSLKWTVVSYDTDAALLSALPSGRCDAASNDMLSLLANQASLGKAADFTLLSDLIAKEPQGPTVRVDDLQWATLVRWVVFALIQAEEMGVTRANVAELAKASKDPAVRRFLDAADDGNAGPKLQAGWPARLVTEFGNDGELYDRHVGTGGLGLDRGLNRLWTQAA